MYEVVAFIFGVLVGAGGMAYVWYRYGKKVTVSS
jgi:hypothetical protein